MYKTGSLIHAGDGLVVRGSINRKRCGITIDTGSNISIVRPDVLGKSALQSVQPVESCLKTVTGERAPIRGRVRLRIQVGSQAYEHETWVADITDECLLGLDFLVPHGCQVDLRAGVLYVANEEIPLTKPTVEEFEPHCYRAVVTSTVSLPPRSEMIVPTQVEGLRGTERWGLVEPVRRNCQREDGVLVGRTLVDLQERQVAMRVLNTADHSKKLKQGEVIAQCQEIGSVLLPPTQDSVGNAEVPAHILQLYERSVADLDLEKAKQVKELLIEYSSIFSKGPDDLGCTGMVKHHIRTADALPIRQRPRRLPHALREEANRAVEEMRKHGVIEPSSSPWSSPVVLVKKPDGSTRFCVDYRRLNSVTHKDSYPLPRIDEMLEALSGSQWFSTLDLKSGYWQVELADEDKEKSAFSTGSGLWQFRVMPFGLCNAPATFERLMECVLTGLSPEIAMVYLDDIIVHASTFKEQLQRLRLVFQQLRGAGLKLSPKKCSLFQRRVKYLGHILSEDGVAVDPAKVESVVMWPTPQNTKEVRSFLGLCSYYRRFIHHFADIARPLHQLTSKNTRFVWTTETDQVFHHLKEVLTQAPVLGFPIPGGKYLLDTDASEQGLGAVLSQVQEGVERPVAYFSRVLSRPERQYCTTRKELLAVVKAIEHFRPYLYGVSFSLRTDHAALKWLLNFREPEGQIARWIQQLQEYDFDIQHRPGLRHNNADALSRRPCLQESCQHCERLEAKSVKPVLQCQMADRHPDGTQAQESITLLAQLDSTAIHSAQLEDPEIGPVLILRKESEVRPSWQEVSTWNQASKAYWAQWQSLSLIDDVLYRDWETPQGDRVVKQLLLPKKLRKQVLQQLHDSVSGGHLGVNKTLGKVRERFYWVQCSRDVRDWCRHCDTCASRRGPSRTTRAPMGQYLVGAPLERIAIDVLGPLPETEIGNKYLLIAQDYFTKWVEAYALPNQEAVTVAEVLVREFVSRFGVPMVLHSDQGRNFESAVFSEMCALLGVEKTRTTPLHPQSDGMVERFNRTLESQLSKFVNVHHRDWDQYVPLLLMAYRTSTHESTKCTPAMMMMGRDLRLPVDLLMGRPVEEPTTLATDYAANLQRRLEQVHEFVRPQLKLTSDRMKERYDILQNAEPLEEGSAVWLYNPRKKKGLSPKFSRPWEGPYVVVKKVNDLVYRIQLGRRTKPKVVHRNRLWLYTGKSRPTWFDNGNTSDHPLEPSADGITISPDPNTQDNDAYVCSTEEGNSAKATSGVEQDSSQVVSRRYPLRNRIPRILPGVAN